MSETNENQLSSEAASRSSDGLGAVCEHGSLKRKCLVCELIAERDRYKDALEEIIEKSAELGYWSIAHLAQHYLDGAA